MASTTAEKWLLSSEFETLVVINACANSELHMHIPIPKPISSLSLNLNFLIYSTFTFMQPRLCIPANRFCLGESHWDCEGKPIEGFTLTFQRVQHLCSTSMKDIPCSKNSCSFPLFILPSLQQFKIWLFMYEDLLQTISLLSLPPESLTKAFGPLWQIPYSH